MANKLLLLLSLSTFLATDFVSRSSSASEMTDRCQLQNISFGESKPNKNIYRLLGSGKKMEIVLDVYSERKSPVDFSDVTLTIRNKKTNRFCTVKDGGIWRRDGVYLSTDESTIVMETASGSGTWLEFYDTSDCRKTANTESGGTPIHVGESRIEVPPSCESVDGNNSYCCPGTVYLLDNLCLPVAQKEESETLNKSLLKLSLSKCAHIKTPQMKTGQTKGE